MSVLFVLVAACATKAPAPKAVPDPPTLPLDAPLPVDPDVRQGQLDNGLRWFVETNAVPPNRAELRLVVNAGSILEDDDQLGLAHVVEHMAFNGTEHFPGTSLVAFLESRGSRFGPHLNAYTSYDRTVYQLQVPTDDVEMFDQSFVVLADWARRVTFDDVEIDKERGVVLEEWRRSLSSARRIQDRVDPLLYGTSRYPDRRPIGTEASLRTFTPEALRRFYDDWYRPDLMAVVAVGDFDPDVVQARIEAAFAPLTGPDAPRERPIERIEDGGETVYGVFTDPELRFAQVQIVARTDLPQHETVGDYRTTLLDQAAQRILGERTSDLARQPDTPFLNAFLTERRYNALEGSRILFGAAKEGRTVDTLRVMLTEVERLRRHGVRSSELNRAKAALLKSFDAYARERQTTDSSTHAAEIVRVFAEGESMPGVEAEVAIAQAQVPTFSVEEISAYVASDTFFGEDGWAVIVTQPDKEGLVPPTEQALQAAIEDVAALDISPLAREAEVGPLLEQAPTPGTIVARSNAHEATLGFTVLTLSNGVTVWHRRTDFQADEVRFQGFSPGGHSWIGDEDFVNAVLAPSVRSASGLGAHDAATLQKWKAGRSFQTGIGLAEHGESLGGVASAQDLEPALQQLYALFVAPQITADGLRQVVTAQAEVIRNRDANPFTAFSDAYTKLVWPDDPRRRPFTLDRLDELTLEGAKAQYATHFGHATDFTFAFVGNLPDDFERLVETYLASLPTRDRDEGWVDRGYRPVRGAHEAVVRRGQDDKAQVIIAFHTPMNDLGWLARNRYFSLVDILAVQLRRELREELGGVYDVTVTGDAVRRPANWTSTTIRFSCDPARVDELVMAAEQAIAQMKQSGPSAQDVRDEQTKNRRSRETQRTGNGFWLTAVVGALEAGDDPEVILDWDARNDALSVEAVREMANLVFGPDRVQVVLRPE